MQNLANCYDDLTWHAKALKLNEDTLARRKVKLGRDHPQTLQSMVNLANSFGHLGRHAEALKLEEETLALQRAKLGRDHSGTRILMGNLANRYDHLGRHDEALKLREEKLTLVKAKLAPDHPDTLQSINDLAWFLATVPDVKLRDPRRAVELAATAARTAPKTADWWGTLGTARYQSGDPKGAIADLEQAIRLRNPVDPRNAYEGFFLAMAHWRLGEKNKARSWFDRSVAWLDRGKKDDAELKRFRAEAAALLGVEGKP
jgi:tetratricopeptide (TPR) repeat protein